MDLKICGITNRDELDILSQEGARYAGLWTGIEGHPRNLNDARFVELAERCETITPVAVSVRRPVKELWALLKETKVRHIQLHGFNAPRDIAYLKDQGLTLIKTVHVDDEGDCPLDRMIDSYRNAGCDVFLIDRFGGRQAIGSSGVSLCSRQVARWIERLEGARVWLAGGLTADRICDLADDSCIEAVDVDSAARLRGGAIQRKAARMLVLASSPSNLFQVA
ncbi:phosphoribosylanthranilate isomerase [Thalassococcus sp. BH17M4-6]|uniref:phosphoribosylanthranilate isomerase n=1 Tax=Thalassococcus sp. BH17M4-6 TaxID=3413148 RepID=UPI003BE0BD93